MKLPFSNNNFAKCRFILISFSLKQSVQITEMILSFLSFHLILITDNNNLFHLNNQPR